MCFWLQDIEAENGTEVALQMWCTAAQEIFPVSSYNTHTTNNLLTARNKLWSKDLSVDTRLVHVTMLEPFYKLGDCSSLIDDYVSQEQTNLFMEDSIHRLFRVSKNTIPRPKTVTLSLCRLGHSRTEGICPAMANIPRPSQYSTQSLTSVTDSLFMAHINSMDVSILQSGQKKFWLWWKIQCKHLMLSSITSIGAQKGRFTKQVLLSRVSFS